MKVTLTLTTGRAVSIDVEDMQAFWRLLNGEDEFATGWVETPGGDWINLLAVVTARPTG